MIEIVVSEVEPLEMAKRENGGIGWIGPTSPLQPRSTAMTVTSIRRKR